MRNFRFEYKFTFFYLLLGLSWILFSDRIIYAMISDPQTLTRVQTYKGWFYVIITAILFYHFLREHLIRLRKAEKRAIESDRLKTAFLQNISHEIRTPMNGIMGFTSLLEEESISEAQKKEYLSYISKSANRLLDLVNQILDISLIETGNITLNNDTVHLNDLLREIHNQWQIMLKEGVVFNLLCGLDDDTDLIITDEHKLKQILGNLVGNAVKFTEQGSVHLGYKRVGNTLEFLVKDTGIGIEPEYHQKIFERFRKADSSSKKLYEGAGLGLAICHSNLELMQGTIGLQSEPGKGTEFKVTIPYKPATVTPARKPSADDQHINLDGVNILVAEDEVLNYKYIEDLLADTGVNLIPAVNGRLAVEYCREHNNVHLVLMDIRMPVMDGYEAAKLIKSIHPRLPVIAQSAYIAIEQQGDMIGNGFDGLLFKPFLKEELMEAITGHVKTGPNINSDR